MVTKETISKLVYEIVGCIITVHKELGPGLLESIYEDALVFELKTKGFSVDQQKDIPIRYKGHELRNPLRCDLL